MAGLGIVIVVLWGFPVVWVFPVLCVDLPYIRNYLYEARGDSEGHPFLAGVLPLVFIVIMNHGVLFLSRYGKNLNN